MNIVQKAILRVCWQEAEQIGNAEPYDKHAPRPWLRWLLTRMVGITTEISRESEMSQLARKHWLALRKQEALRIDPERVEVGWEWGQGPFDWNYFARSPGSKVWVSFDDLPDAVTDRLEARMWAGELQGPHISQCPLEEAQVRS